MTTIKTQIRSLEFVKAALAELGVAELPAGTKVPFFYGSPQTVDFAFGSASNERSGGYCCGFKKDTETGNFQFLADYWGMDTYGRGSEVLDLLGCQRNADKNDAGFGTHWRWATEGVEGNKREGHVGVSGPCKLQQAYIGKVTEYAAAYEGRTLTSVNLPDGDIRHELRGGDLGRSVVVVTAKADGTCLIHVELGDGPSCKTKTELLEKILGHVTDENLTADFYHQRNAAGQFEHVTF
jgi:hypothetical protein